MTPKERENPSLLNGQRRKRLADGSGTDITEVNKLIKQVGDMQKMMKSMSGGKGMAMMNAMMAKGKR